MSQAKKLVLLFSIFFAILAVILILSLAPEDKSSPYEVEVKSVASDLKTKVQKAGPGFVYLNKIDMSMNETPLMQGLVGDVIRDTFKKSEKSNYNLQLEAFTFTSDEDKQTGLVLQISFFDKKTLNKIYELGATYYLNPQSLEKTK